jgi:exosortase
MPQQATNAPSPSLSLGEAFKGQWSGFLFGTTALAIAYAGTIQSMVADWMTDDNASHGFFVPLVSGYLIWLQKSDLSEAKVEPANTGFTVALAAVTMLILGDIASERYVTRLSILVALAGCILFWLGRGVLRRLLAPLCYLLFMIPLPAIVLNAVTMPLKLLVSAISVSTLRLLGIPVLREGSIIMLPNISLEVVEACSGLRSLESLLAFAAAYALIFQKSAAGRTLLIAAAVPIAIFANIVRVVVTGLLARGMGASAAEGFFHESAGIAVFILALAMLAGLHRLMRKSFS